ncbi:predicted protein [Pyrenophora tritici-repentis Pt-1C-BFP]|uniref:Uncharacterized protein n=1 Tax=Pyrenophora tritici-repentis (strain Pt-1C-BFP) TaxID=426418 RepID=B2WG89_PYRTR|nr:uncharacterized protein PTRG_08945 [Pyrenophora tritici-repentis Pt-1C-BFP]EDU41996.1 predicted protein [Pyrenophora tritici-repentis Pt-1C-BFP]
MRRLVFLLAVVLCFLHGVCATTATATAIATSSVGEGRAFQSDSAAAVSSTGSLDETSSLVVQANTVTTPSTSTSTSTPTPSPPPTQIQQSQYPNSTAIFFPQPQQQTTPSPLTKARIVGLAVGLAIADILLVGLCLYYFLHRCRNNLSLLRLKKRFARDKNSNEDVAELRGPPVYAQEREDEGVQYEVYVEPSEVQGTIRIEEQGRRQ